MKVVFDDAAFDDLDEIFAWIAKDRRSAADDAAVRVIATIEQLGRFQHFGNPGRIPGTYEWGVHKLPYVIVYELAPEQNEPIVIGVFYGAQQNRRP